MFKDYNACQLYGEEEELALWRAKQGVLINLRYPIGCRVVLHVVTRIREYILTGQRNLNTNTATVKNGL